ncbi:MAG: WhiB family transcriptional regulator [Acidimicrobiales bacterium]
MSTPTWWDHAACRGADRSWFYGKARPQARRLCRSCPVQDICLWSAMLIEHDAGYRYGLWGGCSPAQRTRIAAAISPQHARDRLAAALARHAENRQ